MVVQNPDPREIKEIVDEIEYIREQLNKVQLRLERIESMAFGEEKSEISNLERETGS